MRDEQSRAFTLLEVLVVLFLLSIASMLLLPAMQPLFQRSQEAAARDQLLSFLEQSRTQSILTGAAHQVCGSSDGQRCDQDWRYWLLVNDDHEVLQRHRLTDALQLCWRGISAVVRYNPDGTTQMGNGRFSLCRQSRVVWQLVVNRQGRIRDEQGMTDGCCHALG